MILIHKCPRCDVWGDFRNDPECKCGFLVFEYGDPFGDNEPVEVMQLDVHKVAQYAIGCGLVDEWGDSK